MEAVANFGRKTMDVKKLGLKDLPLYRAGRGHLVVKISDFDKEKFLEEVHLYEFRRRRRGN